MACGCKQSSGLVAKGGNPAPQNYPISVEYVGQPAEITGAVSGHYYGYHETGDIFQVWLQDYLMTPLIFREV
jgi:hypothetical protein